ncbi:MAG: ribonuclease HII [Clostridiales bacterium]|jgi:ribonuclease HII|nr:ribonuclease HII [Clostridiales bacterium]
MKTDLLKFEREYLEKGYKTIAGCDEAGRGPLAGPVSCAAVIMPLDNIHPDIDDSKKLSPKKRGVLYDYIIKNALAYSVVFIGNEVIDGINIYQAAKRGMETALATLKIRPDVALIDAMKGLKADCPTVPIIHGDALSYSIAAASIVAKVERDRLMAEYAKQYPQYGFEKHMGYPTPAHYKSLAEFGACPLHRRSFLKNPGGGESGGEQLRIEKQEFKSEN